MEPVAPSAADIIAMKRVAVMFGRLCVDRVHDAVVREELRADLAKTMRVIKDLDTIEKRSFKHGETCGCTDCT